MNKLLFIIGMRRSGTSILRELVMSNPEVYDIKFEPHKLFLACGLNKIPRYQRNPFIKESLDLFKNWQNNKWLGAKFALNAGIEAMNWRCLNREFSEAKFIFITRNSKDTYASWIKTDKDNIRGIVSFEMYLPWYKHINDSFWEFFRGDQNKSVIIMYEDLVNNADDEMMKVWDLLSIEPIKGLNKKIRKPENWSAK